MTADTFAYFLDILRREVALKNDPDSVGAYVLCARCNEFAGDAYRAVMLSYASLRVLCPMCCMVERPDPATTLQPQEMVTLILNRYGHMARWEYDGENTHVAWSAKVDHRS